MAIHPRKCLDCGSAFDLWTKGDDRTIVQRLDDELACPKCGAGESRWQWHSWGYADQFEVINTFPRYDRGLGVMLESEEHRRQVCKQMGVVPLEHVPSDFPSAYKEARRKQEEAADRGEAYLRRLEEDPDFADYRRARDEGRLGTNHLARAR